MPTLHIEHAISDYETWSVAYARFAARRQSAGVVSERVSRPADDTRYVLVDLDFDTLDQARAFEQFLREEVWARPESSPALRGDPVTRLLEPAPRLSSTGGTAPRRGRAGARTAG
jgi:hypothetical protein